MGNEDRYERIMHVIWRNSVIPTEIFFFFFVMLTYGVTGVWVKEFNSLYTMTL